MAYYDSEDRFAKYGGLDAQMLSIDLMEGHDFEYWCAGLLRKIGFSHVSVTPGSNDQGVDILAQKEGVKYAIQCKRYSSDLGNTPVQEVHAGKAMYNCHVGVVLTNQHFTTGAKQLAQATGVLLWDRDWIISHLEVPPADEVIDESLESDELFTEAVDAVLETNNSSISMIQKRLNLGYARAARIVDEMEEKGIVGPFQGAKPRAILITKEDWEKRSERNSHIWSGCQNHNRATPDIDPVPDYQPHTVMVEIPDPPKKIFIHKTSTISEKENNRPGIVKRILLSLFAWMDTFLFLVAISLSQSSVSGIYAISAFVFPTLFLIYILLNKRNNKFFINRFSFWSVILFVVLFIISFSARK